MKAINPRFSDTGVTFQVKERLGWGNVNVFPESVCIEHDCDRENPYLVDGHVFYDRAVVHYVPERTCHVVPMDAAGNPPYRKGNMILNEMSDGCSECGYPFDTANKGVPNFCENCGAKVVS